ncbi:F-box protein [Aspergillus homomorphus CBS 101889]|uniref:F-box domain-containing protein n=1 Tax=Aspergillus homomorphus (strain CBS 101889) TaxID=1450537 RepID=A0A395HG31_ASPHC|nr:hypothetical protein BO97DRAFT_419071 [Aspergillus homomorphus CBS 101889]RAL06862.1 hypothetical protein BO97DRAFT_419071 [Aspergillus homomorphus CBS 101889]
MAQLSTLPNEIILAIISCFHGPTDVTELLSLCLTSRRLRLLAQPILFYDYFKYVLAAGSDTYLKRRCRIGPLISFARTLVLRPELGKQVHRVCINVNRILTDCLSDWPETERNEAVSVLTGAIQEMRLPRKADYMSGIIKSRMNPLVTIIATLAPNLEALDIVVENEGLRLLEPLYRPPDDGSLRPPFLSKLRSLHIRDLKKMQHPTMKDVISLMCLPKLEKFSMAFCNGDGLACPDFDLPPGSLALSELELQETTLDATRLTKIIRACKKLEVFTYESLPWLSQTADSCQFPPQALLPCLESQKHNLRSVRINLDVADPLIIYDWRRCPQYGSFDAFRNLKDLDVEQGAMQDFQNLPPFIERLTILCCEHPVYEMMASLADCCRNNFPFLRHVLLKPKYLPACGMLGIQGEYTESDWVVNPQFRESYRAGCCALEAILEGARFSFEVDCDGWDLYHRGDI